MKTKKSSEFKIGEIVVYPKHGVGEITKIENMEVANIKTRFYVEVLIACHGRTLICMSVWKMRGSAVCRQRRDCDRTPARAKPCRQGGSSDRLRRRFGSRLDGISCFPRMPIALDIRDTRTSRCKSQ